MSLMSPLSQRREGEMESTFSEMAEAWMRENLPSTGPPQSPPDMSGGMVDNDPSAWRQDFARWMAENCIHREGREDSAGIGCLLLDFAEWCIAHEAAPCQRAAFETLLEDVGFRCVHGMAAGLILKVDLEAACAFQAAPRAAERKGGASRESLPIRELP